MSSMRQSTKSATGQTDDGRSALQIPERPLPPNPALLAIFLVTRSGSGPRILAHYPPTPSLSLETRDVTVSDGYISEGESDSDSGETHDGHGCSDDDHSTSDRGPRSTLSNPSKGLSEPGYSYYEAMDDALDHSEGRKSRPEVQKSGWDKLFGYNTDSLAKLMAPNSQSWHMNRFEICMGGRTFIGCPAYRFEEGKWRRSKTPKASMELHPAGIDAASGHDWDRAQAAAQGNDRISQDLPNSLCPLDDDESEVPETPDVAAAEKPAFLSTSHEQPSPFDIFSSSTPSNYSATSSNSASSLSMFNIVAVISPPSLEHQLRVEEQFQFVIKPLCVTLKRLQRKQGYIESQSRLLDKALSEARERGLSYDEAWQRISKMSSLANTLRTIFDSISASQVAHLSLKTSSAVDVSIQIPLPTSTPYAPSPMTTQIPGVALSSAILTSSGPATINTPLTTVESISPHAALLLLVDSQELLAKHLASSPLTSSHGMAGPMSYFVRNLTPRKTLLQLSKLHQVSLSHIELLASLLIRWRYARPIEPLHTGNAYIASPNADWNNLRDAREAFAKRYPTLPEMALILSKLHGTGRTANLVPWSALIPSSDHKDAYMDVLAWLMRGGWVTQLRTFAWIRVSPAVKRKVAEQRRREIDDLAKAETLENAVDDSQTDLDELSGFGTPQRRPSSGDDGTIAPPPMVGHHGMLPQHFRSHLLTPQRPVSEAGSTGSNKTQFRIANPDSQPQHNHERQSKSGESHKPPSEHASHATRPKTVASGSTRHRLERRTSLELLEANLDESTIILEPNRLNNTQARWVEHIRQSFADERLRAAWPRLVKYFDGRHALQDIAVAEGWKRKAVLQLLTTLLKENDCLQVVRHW